MIILNHLRTAHFPRMDNFSTLFCRSSDSFPVHRLPVLSEEQWHKYDTPSMELTAAGLFGTFTRFPFHLFLASRRKQTPVTWHKSNKKLNRYLRINRKIKIFALAFNSNKL